MAKNIYQLTLALAGIAQAATLASHVATTGQCDKNGFETMINSLFEQDPRDFISVYQDEANLKIGLKQLVKLMAEDISQQDRNISRYILSLLLLEKRLTKSPVTIEKLGKRLEQTKQQADYFDTQHPTVIASLAQIYLDHISTLAFRIQVIGNPTYINQEQNLHKIRALLLAGIRSAVLWRQMGGNRWQLFFLRKKILATARDLLNKLTPPLSI